MAPSTSPTAHAKRSHSAGSMKQSKLSFVTAKRAGGASAVKGKLRTAPGLRASSSGTSVNKEANSIGSGTNSEYAGTPRARSRDDREVDMNLSVGEGTAGVFRSREGIENSGSVVQAPREKLDPDDKDGRWAKPYAAASAKMGHLQPGWCFLHMLISSLLLLTSLLVSYTVHAEGQTKVHHILRVFDLCASLCVSIERRLYAHCLYRSYEYGPCIGVTRLQRWERADVLGLNPPPEVCPRCLGCALPYTSRSRNFATQDSGHSAHRRRHLGQTILS